MEIDRLVHRRYRRQCQSLAPCTWKLPVSPHLRLRDQLTRASFPSSVSPLIRKRRTWHSGPAAVFSAPESLVGLQGARRTEQDDQDQLKELYSVSGLGAGAGTWQPIACCNMVSCKGTWTSWKINHRKLAHVTSCVKVTCFIGKDSGPENLRQGPRAGVEKQDGKRRTENKDRLY